MGRISFINKHQTKVSDGTFHFGLHSKRQDESPFTTTSVSVLSSPSNIQFTITPTRTTDKVSLESESVLRTKDLWKDAHFDGLLFPQIKFLA